MLALLMVLATFDRWQSRQAHYEVLGWSTHGSVAAVHATVTARTRLGDEVYQEQVILVGEEDESFARVFTLQAPRVEGRKLDTGAEVDAALADMGIAPLRAEHRTPQTCTVSMAVDAPQPLYCSPNSKMALSIDTAATDLLGSYVQPNASETLQGFTGTFRLFDRSHSGTFRPRPIRLDARPSPLVVPPAVWAAFGLIAVSLAIWLIASRRKAS